MRDSTLDHSICGVAATQIKHKMQRASTGLTLILFLYTTQAFLTPLKLKNEQKIKMYHISKSKTYESYLHFKLHSSLSVNLDK